VKERREGGKEGGREEGRKEGRKERRKKRRAGVNFNMAFCFWYVFPLPLLESRGDFSPVFTVRTWSGSWR
jgi:hypothetical protein